MRAAFEARNQLEVTLESLGTSPEGLVDAQASRRLAKNGPNEVAHDNAAKSPLTRLRHTSFGISTLHLAAALRDNGGGRLTLGLFFVLWDRRAAGEECLTHNAP